MAQHDYVIANGTGAAVRSDLNNALAAIVSQNSGATEPATTYAFQFWADTTTGTLKLRNSANSAWIELLQLDGTLTMEDGTEALPGLSFRNDLDTGLWRPGANQLAISTNAVERVEFGASEVVFNDGGANYDFRVEGDTNANLLFVDASADAVGIGTSTPSSDGPLTLANAAETPTIFFSRPSGGSFSAAIQASSFGTLTFYNGAASSTVAGLTPRMTIDGQNGRVGIGTTSPGQLLEINGASNPCLLIKDTTNNVIAYTFADDNVANFGSASAHPVVFRINNNEAARIDTSSRLLLGTSTSPSTGYASGALMVVQGYSGSTTGDAVFSLARGLAPTSITSGLLLGGLYFTANDGSTYAGIQGYCDGSGGTGDHPGRLVFSVTSDGASSPTERFRLGNDGRAGFFTGAEAVVVRSSQGSTSTNNALAVTSGATGTTDGTVRFVVEVRGNVYNQNGVYGSLSDVKLKENIVDAGSQWSDLKNLKVRKYNFKEIPGHTQIGLIAQEVELVSPGLVSESPDRDEDGNDLGTVTKSVNYSVLYMKAVKALQEAMERIEQLEAEMAEVKAQLS